jgi:hypothetical protein
MRDDEYIAIKERAAAALKKIPDVTAVGLGGRERAGRPTGEIVIKVFVKRKKPAAEVPPDQLIPASFEGVPTDVVEMGPMVPHLDEVPGAHHPEDMPGDNTHTNPLEGGMLLGCRAPDHHGKTGTLGCLARDKADGTAVYALTNQHVVADSEGKISLSRPFLRLDKTPDPGLDSFDPLGYTAAATRDQTIDAALLRIDAGFEWLPKIKQIGFVRGTHEVDLAESVTLAYRVRKFGARTGLTGGIVIAIAVERVNVFDVYLKFDMIIRPNRPAAPHENDSAYFSYFGDSGSVVVNDDDEIVGLLWGGEKFEGNKPAYHAGVTPISFVLDHFRHKFGLDVEVASAPDPNATDASELKVVPPPAGAPLVPFAEGLAKRDGAHYRPLVGGSQLEAKPFGFANAGTLGCLVRKTGDPTTAYLMTSYAAMSANGTRPPTTDTDVGQPDNSDSCSLCCSNTVGEFEKGGPDIATRPTAALIKLDNDQRYVAEILQIGLPIQLDGVAINDVNDGTAQVRKRGPGTRLTGGVVTAIGGLVGTLPPGVRSDAMLIRPNVNPLKPDQDRCFSHPIDRGAVVVNPGNHVVGLLYDELEIVENGIKVVYGVASQIRQVFDAFNALPGLAIELATELEPDTVRTTADRVAIEPESPKVRPVVVQPRRRPVPAPSMELPELSNAFARLQEQLLQSSPGFLMITAWREHRTEIRHLIDHNRKVATVWHRSGGPALLQAFLRALQMPSATIPCSVNGIPTATCLDRLATALCRFGSPALQAAVMQVHELLPSTGGHSLNEILAAFGMATADRSRSC